jgi:hypothetical protein
VDGADGTAQAMVTNISSMTRLPDGRFDVVCLDGHHETVTSDQLRAM